MNIYIYIHIYIYIFIRYDYTHPYYHIISNDKYLTKKTCSYIIIHIFIF